MPEVEHEKTHSHLPDMPSVVDDLELSRHRLEESVELVGRLVPFLCILCIVNMVLLALLALNDPVLSAKILILELLTGSASVCLFIGYYHRKILEKLVVAEHMAYWLRDEASFSLQAQRARLHDLNDRLSGRSAHVVEAAIPGMLNTLWPLAMMFVQKERSIFKWGMFGMKLAKNAMDLYQKRSQNS